MFRKILLLPESLAVLVREHIYRHVLGVTPAEVKEIERLLQGAHEPARQAAAAVSPPPGSNAERTQF